MNTLGANMDTIIEEEQFDNSPKSKKSLDYNPFKISTQQTSQSKENQRNTTINESLIMDFDSDEEAHINKNRFNKLESGL